MTYTQARMGAEVLAPIQTFAVNPWDCNFSSCKYVMVAYVAAPNFGSLLHPVSGAKMIIHVPGIVRHNLGFI